MWDFLNKWDARTLRSEKWTDAERKECAAEMRPVLLDHQRQADTHWLWRLTYEVFSANDDPAALRLLAGLTDRQVLTFNDPQMARLVSVIGILWTRCTVREDSLFVLGVLRYLSRATFFRSAALLQPWKASDAGGELRGLMTAGSRALRGRINISHQGALSLFFNQGQGENDNLDVDLDEEPAHPALLMPFADLARIEERYGFMITDFMSSPSYTDSDRDVSTATTTPRSACAWSNTLSAAVYESIVMTVARYLKQNKMYRLLPDLFESSAATVHRFALKQMTAPFFHTHGDDHLVGLYEYRVQTLSRDLERNGIQYQPHPSTLGSLFDHFFMSYLGVPTRRAFTGLAYCVWHVMRPYVDFVAPHCQKLGYKSLTAASFLREDAPPHRNNKCVRGARPASAHAKKHAQDKKAGTPTLISMSPEKRLIPLLDQSVSPNPQPLSTEINGASATAGGKRPKKRIGYISAFYHEIHSVFRDRQGIIRLRRRDEWDVTLFCTEEPTQALNRELFRTADRTVVLSAALAEAQAQVAARELDVLVFCDIGMHPLTYYLAFARLAPLQVNTWGHSDTSGIPTIDYFISSRWFEVADEAVAADMYSERLVLMNGLSTYYQPLFDATRSHRMRGALGVSGDGPLLVCLQSLFKFSDDFLRTLAVISLQNPGATIALLKDTAVSAATGVAEEQKIFEDRLDRAIASAWGPLLVSDSDSDSDRRAKEQNCARARRQFVCLDRLALVPYQSLVMYADLMLDPFPFGGCNSSFESFQYAKPVVTWPSGRLNGRFTLGLYRRMGLVGGAGFDAKHRVDLSVEREACPFDLEECSGIVGGADEYAAAVRRWLSPDGRSDYDRTCGLIQDRRHNLFCDQESVDEWYTLMDTLEPGKKSN